MADMNKPLFDLTPADLHVEVNSYKPGNGLVWPILFPLRFTPKFDLKGIEGNEGIPVSADRVSFNTKAPLKTRKTVGSWSGTLGKYAISREKNEIEINEYKDLQIISAATPEDVATAKYLVDMVYDDVKFVNEGIDYKTEIDAMRIGSRGLHTFPESVEGDMATADIINFNVPTDNFVGVAAAWSDAVNADGIKDILDKQKAIQKKGLRKPMWAIMESSAFELLVAQAKVQKRVASAIINVTGLTASELVTVDTVNAYMRKKGYPQILVIDSYATIENKKGEQTTIKPWNEKVVVLSPIPQLGWTYYKPVPMVPSVDAVQSQGAYSKTTVYSTVNPMLEVTMAEAYVQPGLTNRASLVFMNITNTTGFNEGN